MKKILGAISPPVSVVQLGGCGHLQDVADICIEHVEQDVVLVTVQLYRCKLFSYRCVCEVPAIMDHLEVFKLCVHQVVLKDLLMRNVEVNVLGSTWCVCPWSAKGGEKIHLKW